MLRTSILAFPFLVFDVVPARRKLLLAGFVSTLLVAANRLDACAVIEPSDASSDSVAVASEVAIILWDAKSRTQHFIRRASFRTQAENFGFLVPSPSEPELAEAEDTSFQRLIHAIEPKIVPSYDYQFYWTLLCLPRSKVQGIFATADLALSEVGDVEVLQEKRIAGYDAAVLRANDSQALTDWLSRQGYEFKPEIAEWLKPYVEAGWIITAFKYAGLPKSDAASLNTKAVRMSFVTPRPFYPYREPPSQGQKASSGRALRLFFISDTRVQGLLGGGAQQWPGTIQYADKHGDVKNLLEGILPADRLPKSAWLTAFTDRSVQRPSGEDVYFPASAETKRIVPPPIKQMMGTRVVPLCLDLVSIAGTGVIVLRRVRSRRFTRRELIAHPG